ncbi:MAG: hypothetical protein ACK5K7_04785 [Bacilli bacterium]
METFSDVFSVINGVLIAVLVTVLIIFLIKLVLRINSTMDRVDNVLDSAEAAIAELTEVTGEIRKTVMDLNYKLSKLNVLFDTLNSAIVNISNVRDTIASRLSGVKKILKLKKGGNSNE